MIKSNDSVFINSILLITSFEKENTAENKKQKQK